MNSHKLWRKIMGMAYFHEDLPTDANACNGCQHFQTDGKKHRCKSGGFTSQSIKKKDTTMNCPELEVRAEAGLDKKKKGGGLGGMIKDATIGKAKREVKAAALRDVKSIKRNLGKMI